MLGEVPGHFQPDREDRESQIITPEQKLLGVLLNSTQLPIHPRRRVGLVQTTEEVLASITPRERRVIQYRFMLSGELKKIYKVIGEEYDVSGTRIRQIEDKALRKLRHPDRSKKLKNYTTLEADSVASSVAELTDEGFSLIEADLAPLAKVPLSELKVEGSPLMEFVRWRTLGNWNYTGEMLRVCAQPFFQALSNDQIATFKESITRVYGKAKEGFYQEPEQTTPEATQKLIYSNRLFPNMRIPFEDLIVIGSVPIDELGLSTLPHNALKRHWMSRFDHLPTLADLLSLTPEEFLYNPATYVRYFGKNCFRELEQRVSDLLIERPGGESKSVEEIIREIICRLPEVPAGKYPLTDGEWITNYRSDAEFTLTKNTIHIDGRKVSFLGLSLSGKPENKEQVIREFTQALGKPSTQISSTRPEEIDFLSWLL